MKKKSGGGKPMQAKFDPAPKKEKNTRLADDLKTGVESLSGSSMDDVKVNYNSSKPAQLEAEVYADGIHIAPAQEKHLPREAWRVVQQKQGRVKPTPQIKPTVAINDDKELEEEADLMGKKATSFSGMATVVSKQPDN